MRSSRKKRRAIFLKTKMTPITQLVTQLSSFATLIADLAILIGFYFLLTKNKFAIRMLAKHAVWLAFVVSLSATLLSLYYSEIAHFAPCKLCWYQRIFLFPQPILFGIAIWKKLPIVTYSLALSVIGALIAAYHTALQFDIAPSLPCTKEAVSCTQRFILEYGYITIPTMSLTAFLLLIILMLFARFAKT